MELTVLGMAIETRLLHCSKAVSPMEVKPPGTSTWPFASGVYRQPAATPPSASRSTAAESMCFTAAGLPASCARLVMFAARCARPADLEFG
eukprot:scaffold27326_cov48-Phaeocystis_antarctica.AAC.1